VTYYPRTYRQGCVGGRLKGEPQWRAWDRVMVAFAFSVLYLAGALFRNVGVGQSGQCDAMTADDLTAERKTQSTFSILDHASHKAASIPDVSIKSTRSNLGVFPPHVSGDHPPGITLTPAVTTRALIGCWPCNTRTTGMVLPLPSCNARNLIDRMGNKNVAACVQVPVGSRRVRR
jgi:hypothetical protein